METVVVGAGIVGLTTAFCLCQFDRSVAVVEALRTGEQVTGRSTAKITTQHGLIYHKLIEQRGLKAAKAYAEANVVGAGRIREWVHEHRIACDLEVRPAYVYASESDSADALATELGAVQRLGLEGELLDRAPLPFDTSGCMRFPDQAQFNPVSYLKGLAYAVVCSGGQIFEGSRATEFDGEVDHWRVGTRQGTIRAQNVVVATNITVKSPVGMSNKTQPRSHVAIAFRSNHHGELLDGMFLSMDEPHRSLRMARDEEGPLLLMLGPRFNTGQDGNVARRFLELQRWAVSHLPVGPAVWRWCNEDYDTPDQVPYVGAPDPEGTPGFYVATGFNAWGITNGTAAGIMLADLIAEGSSPWQALYDPARPAPDDFHKSGESQSLVRDVSEIARGHGGVVEKNGDKIAMWRDYAGELHSISAVCTHKGCIVTWNNADRTWDCPCHGSIFAADGSVIHGPARKGLGTAEVG